VVESVIRVMDRPAAPDTGFDPMNPTPSTSRAPYRVYNIGNNNPVNLMRYIEVLEKCLGKKAKLELLPMQPGDVPATVADVSNLQEAVDFRPNTSVEVGVACFVERYRSYCKV